VPAANAAPGVTAEAPAAAVADAVGILMVISAVLLDVIACGIRSDRCAPEA
jgi:hypothetical protein